MNTFHYFFMYIYTRKRTFEQAEAVMFADKKTSYFYNHRKRCSLAIWCEVQKIKDK